MTRKFANVETGSARPQRAPRRDYSNQDSESVIVEALDDETNTTLSRKRKRTETGPSTWVLVPYKTFFVFY